MNVMLAYNKVIDPEQLTYPVIASIKEDGYRCAIVDGKPQTRSGKQLANIYTREALEALDLPELDGELVLRDSKSFNSVQSAFGSHGGKPNLDLLCSIALTSLLNPMNVALNE